LLTLYLKPPSTTYISAYFKQTNYYEDGKDKTEENYFVGLKSGKSAFY